MKYSLAIFIFLIGGTQSYSQDVISKNIYGNDTSFSFLRVGVETSTTSYINTDTKDSNGVHLFVAPYIDYNHKSGLGFNFKAYALPGGSDPGFYLSAISPYYAKYNGKLLPYISYTRYIQHDNPSVPYSPIQNEIYAHLRLKTRYIDPIVGVDFGFGQDEQNNDENVSDVNAFVGVSHLFVLGKSDAYSNNALGFRPALQLNAGTDRYFKFMRTTKYISQNTTLKRMGYTKGRGNNSTGDGSSTTEDVYTISETNEFNLSNVEANIYLMYFFGKFSIEPSGSLYFPLRGDDRTPYGYWQVNLNYWIK